MNLSSEQFTLEKMQIDKRLQEIEKTLISLDKTVATMTVIYTQTHEAMTTLLGKQANDIYSINKILNGDAEKNVKGHSERLNNLEEIEETRRWTIKAMWTAILGVFVKIVYDVFRGHLR